MFKYTSVRKRVSAFCCSEGSRDQKKGQNVPEAKKWLAGHQQLTRRATSHSLNPAMNNNNNNKGTALSRNTRRNEGEGRAQRRARVSRTDISAASADEEDCCT